MSWDLRVAHRRTYGRDADVLEEILRSWDKKMRGCGLGVRVATVGAYNEHTPKMCYYSPHPLGVVFTAKILLGQTAADFEAAAEALAHAWGVVRVVIEQGPQSGYANVVAVFNEFLAEPRDAVDPWFDRNE